MKKSVNGIIIMFVLSFGFQVYGQEANPDVVFAGRNFTWGLNMSSFDLAILLRENGTFCESLDAPDWQTKVDGRYEKVKDGILLEYMDNTMDNDTIFIEKDSSDGYEDISYSGAQMIKMRLPNSIPEGYYEYKGASRAGGIGAGMVFVETQQYDGIHFYANGTFDRNSSGGVAVRGSSIGGGTGSDKDTSGTYTIEKGVLTLVNTDGEVAKNSFFYSEPDDDETFTVAMNGTLFFSGGPETGKSQLITKETKITNATTLVIPDVEDKDVLEKIKSAHGGSGIDSIATVEAVMETSGIEFKVLLDLKRKFLRLESLSPTFRYIEQLEDESGWMYQDGQIQEIPDNRVAEMRNTFYSGLFLLQTPVLNRIKVLDVRDNGKGFKVLKLNLDGNISGMVMDSGNNRLVGTAKFNALGNEITYLSDFREVDGILIAFKEEVETDGQNVLIQNNSYTINPVWDSTVWERPD